MLQSRGNVGAGCYLQAKLRGLWFIRFVDDIQQFGCWTLYTLGEGSIVQQLLDVWELGKALHITLYESCSRLRSFSQYVR